MPEIGAIYLSVISTFHPTSRDGLAKLQGTESES